MSQALKVICVRLLLGRPLNVPVCIAAGQTAAYCAANPVLAEAVQRLDAKEAATVIQVRGNVRQRPQHRLSSMLSIALHSWYITQSFQELRSVCSGCPAGCQAANAGCRMPVALHAGGWQHQAGHKCVHGHYGHSGVNMARLALSGQGGPQPALACSPELFIV